MQPLASRSTSSGRKDTLQLKVILYACTVIFVRIYAENHWKQLVSSCDLLSSFKILMFMAVFYRNLSLNQFTGVLDGSLRASGHVNVFLINNNISAVANLPNPFIDPKYVLHSSCV
jgi:hypothetical protein